MYLRQAEDLLSDDTGHGKQSRDQTRPKQTARLLEARLQADTLSIQEHTEKLYILD